MSRADLEVAVVALVCFYLLWRCLSLARRLRRIERTSKIDPLTGLGSGDWLHAERWPAALRSGRPLGVLYLDLDHLKLRNDRFGHAVGDVYIRTAAAELARALRRGVDEIFRLHTAGDEFIALLHGPIRNVELFAHSLLRRLRSRGITASVGLAYSTRTEHVPERVNLRNLAEASCREAKQRGGDCVVIGLGLDDSGDVTTGLIVDGTEAPARHDELQRGSGADEAIPELIEEEPPRLDGPVQRARHSSAVDSLCPLGQGAP